MIFGEVYLCKLTGKKYCITTISWGNGHASNIADPSDIIFITSTDIANGHYILFEAASDTQISSNYGGIKQDCGNYHYWQAELNFQFETEYCRRCGTKRHK